MGWLGIAGGAADAVLRRREQERTELALQEREMINTMLPIALQNRAKRQEDRKKYKEQYNTLIDIVSPDIAQSIMRKGDEFTQGFIAKVGEMENSLGRQVTEAELIERGDIKPPMETFGGAPVGYRKMGTNFDTFMNELMGDFQNTDIDTNKVKEGIILGFGKLPGYEKALTHSSYRKLAATLGVSPNEVSSLVTDEYDYTDTPDEMFRPKVKMPFVKGEQYYNTETSKLQLQALEEASQLRIPIMVNKQERMVTFNQAIDILGYREAKLQFERLQKALLVTDAQKTAVQYSSVRDALKSPLTAMARILGGTYTINPVDGQGTYNYEGGITASKLRDISQQAEGILRNHYFNTVATNSNLEANAQFAEKANLSDPEFLRKVILSSAQSIDPSGFLVKNLIGEEYGSEGDPHYMGKDTFSVADKKSFERVNNILVKEGYFDPSVITAIEDGDEGTSWSKTYNTEFVKLTNKIIPMDIAKRTEHVDDYQETVIKQLETYLGQSFNINTMNAIRKELNFTGIFKDRKMPFRTDPSIAFKGKTKLEAMQEKIEGLPEFVKGLDQFRSVTDTDVDTDVAADVDTDLVAADVAADVTADETGGITIGEGDNTGTWSGPVTEDGKAVGVGRITRKDGSTSFGELDLNEQFVGPWIITKANGDSELKNFPMTEVALKSIKQKLDATNTFTDFTIRKFSPYYENVLTDELYDAVVGIREKLRDSYDAYKRGEVRTKDFINTMKELGLAIDEQVEKVWVDEGVLQLGGREHKEYLEDFAKFKKEFNID